MRSINFIDLDGNHISVVTYLTYPKQRSVDKHFFYGFGDGFIMC